MPIILIYILSAVAGVAILWGAKHSYDSGQQDIGAKKIEEKYAPIIAVCDSLPAPTGLFAGKLAPKDCAVTLRTGLTAISANVSLQEDLKRLGVERQACSDEVARIQRQGARAAAISAARKPADEAALAAIAPEKAALIAALGLPEPGTCEQRIARRDAMWAKVAAQRQRDFPPDKSPPASGDVNIKGPAK